jgi:hypothetical protein
MVVMLSLIGALIAICVWGLICNEITYRQRDKICDKLFDKPEWRELVRYYDQIDYDRHMYRLMIFRNPWCLYHPSLRGLLPKSLWKRITR